MNQIERRNLGMAYKSDNEVFEEQRATRKLLQELNTTDISDFEKISEIVKKLVRGDKTNIFINPPFHCDYGFNIHVGKNFFANYNCTILDVAKVEIGDNVLFAPNVAIYTAGHPIHPVARASGYEYGIEVRNTLPQSKFDAIILAVAHNEFHNLDILMFLNENGVVYDVKGILDRSITDARL